MLTTPNGCLCSKLSVFPKNWEKGKPDISRPWYISYRFYDPERPKPKQVIIKGMNVYNTLPERRAATQALLANEKDLLFNKGYNPFIGKLVQPITNLSDIHGQTPFIPALKATLDKLTDLNPGTRKGIGGVIKGVGKAANQLGYADIPIESISRRHIKLILEQCSRNSDRWSNNTYNTYRAYLMMLYRELVELEAAPANPIHDISKKQVTQRIKTTLTNEQRKLIDEHLTIAFPAFRNFIHLFFHSGGRKTELLQLKPGMIDLNRQVYKTIVKKGKQRREVERTIKTIALPFWEYFLNGCPNDCFLFGTALKPGNQPMGKEMPTRYWKKFVKEQLSIDVDFYSLKHLNTAEVVDALDEAAAATLNAHTSTAMVVNIYDVKQKERQHKRLKDVGNSFA
jgi:integrase